VDEGVTSSGAVWFVALYVAVIVTAWIAATVERPHVNPASVAPAGTVTVAGTVAPTGSSCRALPQRLPSCRSREAHEAEDAVSARYAGLIQRQDETVGVWRPPHEVRRDTRRGSGRRTSCLRRMSSLSLDRNASSFKECVQMTTPARCR